jgi:hypothetical protein
MYKVTIIEKWRSHITENTYSFNESKTMEKFISMCDDNNALIIVHNSKKAV